MNALLPQMVLVEAIDCLVCSLPHNDARTRLLAAVAKACALAPARALHLDGLHRPTASAAGAGGVARVGRVVISDVESRTPR